MRNCFYVASLLLVSCGGGGGDYVDLVPPAALELNEHFGSVAVADFDADGFPDVVIITDNSVHWVPQNAADLGTFHAPRSIGQGRNDVQLGDVNQDGLLDVVVLSVDGDVSESVLIYYNNTSAPGQFHTPRRLTAADFANHIGIADYDGNGRIDIAVAVTQIDSDDFDMHGAIVIFRQNAADSFSRSGVTRTGGIGVTEVFETAQLDDDVFPEIVFQIGAVVRIMESNASGTPTILLELNVPDEPDNYSTGSGRLSIGDLNNDTLDDIAVVHNGLYVFFRQPGGALTFDEAVKLNTPP